MAMAWKCFCFDFAILQHIAPLDLQWPLAQLFPTALAGSSGWYTVYLSLMSMTQANYIHKELIMNVRSFIIKILMLN
jgi:hypothetical protein